VSYVPRFAFPWMLLLLGLVPWSVWAGIRIRSLPPVRKVMAVVLRSLMLAALVVALAGAELVKRSDKLAVFFLLDHSNSVPEAVRLGSAQLVRNYCEQFMRHNDEAGVIAFGEEASIETSVAPALKLDEIKSFVGGEQTDMAGAIRLATAAFPQGYMKRMVVFSDGNETRGSALEEAKLAQAAGIEVGVVPLMIGGGSEVRIRDVISPSKVNADEPFQLRVEVEADQDCEATLRLYQRMKSGKQLMREQKVTVHKGVNPFLMAQELRVPGFYEYEATVDSDADTILANNEGRTFSVVRGEPTVLYVEGDPEHSLRFGPALKAEGLNVMSANPASMPTSLAQFQNYDVVVLSDVSATDLSSDQLKSIELMVRDLGIGFVMIGGPKSFGAGGYFDTPVETALPVSMDIKQRKILPRGALVLIMHTCEMPEGNKWARDIAIASLKVLSSQDLMGTLAYHWQRGSDWIYPLQPVGDKTKMEGLIHQASTSIGDMPDVGTTLEMAYHALKDADAGVKRVVIISDGDPAAPSAGLLDVLAAAKIAVSTVCIWPHSANDEAMLNWIAAKTGGQYYRVQDPTRLPQIFAKEAAVVKRGLLNEKEFVPKLNHSSDVVQGFYESPFPSLKGYVVTTAKDNATVPLVSEDEDPVLAHWRYGLGKSAAFTSDVTGRWAAEWLNWEGFNRFWAQTVRWALREVMPTDFRVETKAAGGTGYVKIDAVDEGGRFVNFLRPKGVVTGPPPGFERQELQLIQTGPGIYEGKFPLEQRGVYMMNLSYTLEDGSQGLFTTGLSLDYSREYEYKTTNRPLLEQVASVGGGAILGPESNPFVHNLVSSPTITPIWMYLVAFAACIFPLEIFVRRVVVNFRAAYVWSAALLRKVPALRRVVPAPALKPAPVTGTYIASPSPQYDFAAGGEGKPRYFGVMVTEERPGGEAAEATAAETAVGEAERDTLGHFEYTQRLLAAKRRALERRRLRGSQPEDKENG